MACTLTKQSASEFEGASGGTFDLDVTATGGSARILAASYAGRTLKKKPFAFTVVDGRHALVAIIEATKPSIVTSLDEACGDDGTRQVLKRRKFNPDDPAFIVVVTGR